MRIAIDARLYGPAKNKGLGRYVEQLVKNLELIDKENEYFILLRKENWDEPSLRSSSFGGQVSNSRFKKVLADYKWYSLAEQIFLPLKLWRLKVDLVHFPHFNVPLLYRGKFVVTIHDLIMYKFPDERATMRNKLVYKIKYWLHKVVVKSAVRRAARVIAVSEWTKKDVVNEFGINNDKINVIYLGYTINNVSVDKVNTIVNKVNNDDTNVFNKYNIKSSYLLYVGNAYPHKNLERLIEALPDVRCKMLDVRYRDLQLVLVGKKDFFYQKLTSNILHPTSNIIFTDYVSNDELAELYRNATAYIFPSLYEGFGLPGLEAMSYGVPVLSSNASCLPEIYGEAALYFNPNDAMEMSKKIVQLLCDESLRQGLVNKGFEQIKKYSWRRCAEFTLDTYAHLLI